MSWCIHFHIFHFNFWEFINKKVKKKPHFKLLRQAISGVTKRTRSITQILTEHRGRKLEGIVQASDSLIGETNKTKNKREDRQGFLNHISLNTGHPHSTQATQTVFQFFSCSKTRSPSLKQYDGRVILMYISLLAGPQGFRSFIGPSGQTQLSEFMST